MEIKKGYSRLGYVRCWECMERLELFILIKLNKINKYNTIASKDAHTIKLCENCYKKLKNKLLHSNPKEIPLVAEKMVETPLEVGHHHNEYINK